MTTMDNVAEASLEGLCAQELAGAYKALCGMMLIQTATAFRKRPCARKDMAKERNAAREWVTKGSGVLTFGECCEVMGMDEDRTRRALYGLAAEERKTPINHVTFGVRRNAHLADANPCGAGNNGS